MEILKISSKSNPNSVAGAIAGLVKESNKAEMQAIGAGALNQAVKAVAIARGFVAPAGVDLVCIPAFAEVEVEGEDRTGENDGNHADGNQLLRPRLCGARGGGFQGDEGTRMHDGDSGRDGIRF